MSPVRFRPKTRHLRFTWMWAHRPSIKGSKLLFPVIKANQIKIQAYTHKCMLTHIHTCIHINTHHQCFRLHLPPPSKGKKLKERCLWAQIVCFYTPSCHSVCRKHGFMSWTSAPTSLLPVCVSARLLVTVCVANPTQEWRKSHFKRHELLVCWICSIFRVLNVQ